MNGDLGWKHFLETEARVRFVTVGEHRLRVIEVGAGEPVLLVHGFADSAYTWHCNLRALAGGGFRALAYDHPGCGESALPAGFRFGVDDLARLALDLVDALGIERVHLIGHSMGGGVGLQLAAHHPERLHRVVLVAPTCYHAPFRPFIHLFRSSLFGALTGRLSAPWLVRPVLHLMYGNSALLTRQALLQYRMAFRRPEYVCACAGMLRDHWSDAFVDTARRYRDIRVPLHLVWGRRDIWVSARSARRLAADIGADLTTIAGVGHLVHQVPPESRSGGYGNPPHDRHTNSRFNETVVRFLGAGR
jgi:pimeloyl-ACP methyl ester carboxylesterase